MSENLESNSSIPQIIDHVSNSLDNLVHGVVTLREDFVWILELLIQKQIINQKQIPEYLKVLLTFKRENKEYIKIENNIRNRR